MDSSKPRKRQTPEIAHIVLVVPLIPLLVFTSCIIDRSSQYQGDGTCSNTSRWYFPYFIRGFRVDFEEFDMSEDYQARYRIAELPIISEQDRDFKLVVVDGERWIHQLRRSHAELIVEVHDESGTLIVRIDERLDKLKWAVDGSEKPTCVYGYDPRNILNEQVNGEFIITVKYKGDSALPTKGLIRIDCGGSI